MFKNKTLLLLTTGVLVFNINTPAAQAAKLSLIIEKNFYQIEEKFDITIFINSPGENINAIEGKLILPNQLLKINQITTENSIVDIWTVSPDSAYLTSQEKNIYYTEINFSGAITKQFNEENGEIFSISVAGLRNGSGEIETKNVNVFLSDGNGTQIMIENTSQTINIEKGADDTSTPASETENTLPEDQLDEETLERIETYALEQQTVTELGIVTKDFTNVTSRCEFIVMNGRAAGWDKTEQWTNYQDRTTSEYFVDLNALIEESDEEDSPTWCVSYADYAHDFGIIEGRTENELGLGSINRFEVAVILARQLAAREELEFYAGEETDFIDKEDIVDWAKKEVSYCQKLDIFKGFDLLNGTFAFRGDEDILKIDAAIVLWRAFGKKLP